MFSIPFDNFRSILGLHEDGSASDEEIGRQLGLIVQQSRCAELDRTRSGDSHVELTQLLRMLHVD